MTKLYALPSPKNTNVEHLYSDAAWLAPRGPAYDYFSHNRRVIPASRTRRLAPRLTALGAGTFF